MHPRAYISLNSARWEGAGSSPRLSCRHVTYGITHRGSQLQGSWRGKGERETCARYLGFVRPYEYSRLTFAAMKIRLPRSYGGSTCSALQHGDDDNVDDDDDDGDDDERAPCSSTSSSCFRCARCCALSIDWWSRA